MPTDPEAVLGFWFGPDAGEPEAVAARRERWFVPPAGFDGEMRARFEGEVLEATRGGLGAWEDAPRSALALVLLLDQFPRNLYRGTARAFAGDERALGVAQRGMARRLPDLLTPIERAFFYMPFEHAEDPVHQARSVVLFEALVSEAPGRWRPALEPFVDFARRHRDVVERFGRFPHRNVVLGRRSTPEEEAHLAGSTDSWGQSSPG